MPRPLSWRLERKAVAIHESFRLKGPKRRVCPKIAVPFYGVRGVAKVSSPAIYESVSKRAINLIVPIMFYTSLRWRLFFKHRRRPRSIDGKICYENFDFNGAWLFLHIEITSHDIKSKDLTLFKYEESQNRSRSKNWYCELVKGIQVVDKDLLVTMPKARGTKGQQP